MPQIRNFIFVVAAVMAVLVVLALLLGRRGRRGARETPRARAPLTAHEQAMFARLREALPHLVVMPQVAFSALLTAREWAARATFDRKVADFVLCDAGFRVLAVVELDDRSHDGREAADAARDRLLTHAGYRVLRYRGVPAAERLRADLRHHA